MNRVTTSLLAAFVLVLAGGPAYGAMAVRLVLTAPAAVGMGEEIIVEVRLTTVDGRAVAGAVLTLYQVGAVGQHKMGTATTNENGVASFAHSEYTVAHLALRVIFAGDAQHEPGQADAEVAITDVEIPPAVVMAHAPGSLVKGILFSILGAVWLTYLFAASCVIRIIRSSGEIEPARLRRIAMR